MNKIVLSELLGSSFEIISSGFSTGQENMDFDTERTMAVSRGEAKPMFRLYGWNPWTVSLGANQDENEIDKELCGKKGFGLVRRPTGGRAVLHGDELTYSVVMPLPKDMTVHDAYKRIHMILITGFAGLGIDDLDFHKSQPDFNALYKQNDMSVSCFASSARWEIAWQGRKIVGSAQRLFGNTLLQHGSILLDDGHEQIADVARTYNEAKRESLKNFIITHSATLSQAAGRKITYDEAEKSIMNCIVP